MSMTRTGVVRRFIGWTMLGVFVLSLSIWYFTRETLPDKIRIATAPRGSMYFAFAGGLAETIEKLTGRPVLLIESEGSIKNREYLLTGRADFALLQAGSVSSQFGRMQQRCSSNKSCRLYMKVISEVDIHP